jgi:hypothetical protein
LSRGSEANPAQDISRLPSSPSPAWSRSSASSTPLATRLSDLDRCACTPYTRTEHLDRFTHANFSLRPLVCHVAMAAQAMSMVARFDSSFLCRLGASVELLHHLHDLREERPCIERILMCARVTACRAACAAHSRYGSISRCTRWSERGSLGLRRVGTIRERTKPVQTGRGTLSTWVPRATSHIYRSISPNGALYG